MEKLVHHRLVLEAAAALLAILLCVIFFVLPNSRGNRTVDHSQQAMIAEVEKAHLLGAGKPEVVAFFKQQNVSTQKSYGTLWGDEWEEYRDSKVTTATHGIILTGSRGVVAETTGLSWMQKKLVD